jgi:hypothetical protein
MVACINITDFWAMMPRSLVIAEYGEFLCGSFQDAVNVSNCAETNDMVVGR